MSRAFVKEDGNAEVEALPEEERDSRFIRLAKRFPGE